MEFVTNLKRLLPLRVIEKGNGRDVTANAKQIILSVEGELYIRTIHVINKSTAPAKVSIYSGDPDAGGVEIFRITLGAGESRTLTDLKGLSATSDVYVRSDQDAYVYIGGEDYAIGRIIPTPQSK